MFSDADTLACRCSPDALRSIAPSNGQPGWSMSDGEQELVERFGRSLVAERLAGPAVQCAGNGLDLLGVPPGEVGALGKVLTQQPVALLARCQGLCGSAK